MELTNEFAVATGLDRAWGVLTDVETIAPCLPGAQLTEIEGDDYRGTVKVKVGPITAQYKGTATFVEQDRDARRLVLRAEGRETRGQGNAAATITAELVELGADRTQVRVTTDLTLSGKVAQFGRGVLADVSAKLMDQFADNLAETVLSDAASGGAGSDATPSVEGGSGSDGTPGPAPEGSASPGSGPADQPGLRLVDSPEAAPVDLMATAGAPVARRLVPVAVAVVVLLLVRWAMRRRS